MFNPNNPVPPPGFYEAPPQQPQQPLYFEPMYCYPSPVLQTRSLAGSVQSSPVLLPRTLSNNSMPAMPQNTPPQLTASLFSRKRPLPFEQPPPQHQHFFVNQPPPVWYAPPVPQMDLVNLQQQVLHQSPPSATKARLSPENTKPKPEKPAKAALIRGEKRLYVTFSDLGKACVDRPQTCGKNGCLLIPDGLKGSHCMYNEEWEFEIVHEPLGRFEDNGVKCTLLTWKVTNRASGKQHQMTESRGEALLRMTQGRTISNRIFREALEARARDLEATLEDIPSQMKRESVQNLINTLRPKQFLEGLLVFGLHHKAVQQHMLSGGESTAAPSSSEKSATAPTTSEESATAPTTSEESTTTAPTTSEETTPVSEEITTTTTTTSSSSSSTTT